MTRRLRELVAQGQRAAEQPGVKAARCVHGLLGDAGCRACIEACPEDAWLLTDDALALRSDRCDGCGLCVPACPEGALVLSFPLRICSEAGRSFLLAACERALPRGGETVLPCLHVIGLRQLTALYRQGVRQLRVLSADCDSCPRGTGGRLQERLHALSRALESLGLEGIGLEHCSLQAFRRLQDAVAASPSGVAVSRRAFLQRLGRGGAASAEALSMQGLEEEREGPPGELLPDRPGVTRWPWQPRLDPGRCNGCDACIRLCPHRAITLQDDAQGAIHYLLEPRRCTGCGLCRDVCDQDAIRLLQWQPQPGERHTVPLREVRCRACGTQFHIPVEHPLSYAGKCRICTLHDHHSSLFQVLE